MGLHTVLYRSATAAAANFAALSINPAPGDNVANNVFLPPMDMDIVGAAAFSATMTAARIQTSLLMQTASLHCNPFTAAAALPTNFNWADFTSFPVSVRKNENVNVQTSASGAGETQNVIVFFGDKNYSRRREGRRIRARFTGTTTVTAGAWTMVTLTPDESLPASRFQCIAFQPIGATLVLGRLMFPGFAPNGIALMPGMPGGAAGTSRLPYPLMDGRLGVLGEFSNTTVPQLQNFSTAADTAQTVLMDLIQLDAY